MAWLYPPSSARCPRTCRSNDSAYEEITHCCSTCGIGPLFAQRDNLPPCQLTFRYSVHQADELTFSAILAASFALGRVVLIVSWCKSAETRFLTSQLLIDRTFNKLQHEVAHRSRAHLCDGVRCSFLSLIPCFIVLYALVYAIRCKDNLELELDNSRNSSRNLCHIAATSGFPDPVAGSYHPITAMPIQTDTLNQPTSV